jgi:hypothetical protein
LFIPLVASFVTSPLLCTFDEICLGFGELIHYDSYSDPTNDSSQILCALARRDLAVLRMDEVRSVAADVLVRASGGSATATGLDPSSDGNIIVPFSFFFPSLAVTLEVI